MTSPEPAPTPRPERRRRPRAWPVVGGSMATFLAVFALLGFQMQSGHDPLLGSGTQVASVRAHSGSPTVTTRTSGGGPATTTTTTSGSHKTGAKPIRTATSGGTGRRHDD